MEYTHFRTIALTVTLVLVAIIPTASFVLSENFRSSSSASSGAYTKTVTSSPSGNPKTLKPNLTGLTASNSAQTGANTEPSPTPSPELVFGPTLTFNVKLDGRPPTNQATKMFVGIAAGSPTNNPSYLLSFTVDVPANGTYKGLSIAGLTVGSTYTAYLKGKAQIATASAFLMGANETVLNNNQALNLLSGDLNEDNLINDADVVIFKQAFGSTASSPNWNPEADFNVDGVITALDYAVMAKNINKSGQSGTWISTPATGSASLQIPPNIGAAEEENNQSGYWMWIPKY